MTPKLSKAARLLLVGALALTAACVPAGASDSPEPHYDARLVGKIGDVTRPESVWIGAIEVRFRTPFVLDDRRDDALEFMRALAVTGREVECRLTGARMALPGGGALVGDCVVFGPTDGREIDLGGRLIERGFARPCEEPAAMITIWPPVFDCL